MSCTTRPSKSIEQELQWRSEKRKEQKMLVDVVEAERVSRDIALAASCSFHVRDLEYFTSGIEGPC